MFSVESCLKLKDRGYKIHDNYPNGYMEIGRLTVTHGSWTPIYTAAKHLNEYRSSVMFGHSHTSQLFYVGGLKHKQVGINIGCMCDVDSKGMNYAKKTARWVQGWAIVYEDEKGFFWTELINGHDGKFVYNHKVY